MNHIVIINIAKNQLGMAEDDYRAMLLRVTGEASLRAMSERQKLSVLDELKRLGFKVRAGSKSHRPQSEKPYVRLIFALWGDLKARGIWREASIKSLRTFTKKMTGVDDPEFLSYPEATTVIEALKKMRTRSNAEPTQ